MIELFDSHRCTLLGADILKKVNDVKRVEIKMEKIAFARNFQYFFFLVTIPELNSLTTRFLYDPRRNMIKTLMNTRSSDVKCWMKIIYLFVNTTNFTVLIFELKSVFAKLARTSKNMRNTFEIISSVCFLRSWIQVFRGIFKLFLRKVKVVL